MEVEVRHLGVQPGGGARVAQVVGAAEAAARAVAARVRERVALERLAGEVEAPVARAHLRDVLLPVAAPPAPVEALDPKRAVDDRLAHLVDRDRARDAARDLRLVDPPER